MYNKIYDIKNNKYISTQSNRAKNIIISYAQKGSAKDIVNIGNGVYIIFDNNNLQQELEDAKKLPGSYPSNEPYKKNLTGRPKWHDKKDNENFRLYEIKKDTIEQLLDDISQYENTKEIEIIEARNKPTWLPPQPFLNLGVKTRLIYERLKARSEI